MELSRKKELVNHNFDSWFKILKITFFSGLVAYYLFIIDGLGHPDSICEGLYYYGNLDWATMCGRWAVRYLSFITSKNVVLPGIVFCIYVFAISLSTYFISELFIINNNISIFLVSSLAVVTPVIVRQLTFSYLGSIYAIALLTSVSFCYFSAKDSLIYNIIAIICLAISMGLYQAYLSLAATIIIMNIIILIIDDKSLDEILKKLVRYVFVGILGCVLNVIIYKFELYWRNLKEASRVSEFSIYTILISLKGSLVNAYKTVAMYYSDELERRFFFLVIFVFFIGIVIKISIELILKKRIKTVIILIAGILILPIVMNFVSIIIPYNGISDIMKYQYVMFFPFAICLLERVESIQKNKANNFIRISRYVIQTCMFGLLVSYIISANITFLGLRISYNSMEKQTDMILAEVMKLEGYEINSTPVIFIGSPNDNEVKKKFGELYKYSLVKESPAFYNSFQGLEIQKTNYILDFWGIDTKQYSYEDYYNVIDSIEFNEMPIWPHNGSVRMFGNNAVVKLTDNPYDQR